MMSRCLSPCHSDRSDAVRLSPLAVISIEVRPSARTQGEICMRNPGRKQIPHLPSPHYRSSDVRDDKRRSCYSDGGKKMYEVLTPLLSPKDYEGDYGLFKNIRGRLRPDDRRRPLFSPVPLDGQPGDRPLLRASSYPQDWRLNRLIQEMKHDPSQTGAHSAMPRMTLTIPKASRTLTVRSALQSAQSSSTPSRS